MILNQMSEQPLMIEGEGVILRDYQPEDEDLILYWFTHGEWRQFDAPWEGVVDSFTPEKEEAFRARFRENIQKPRETPRKKFIICLADSTPIGWVNRYGSDRFPGVFYLGIDICEDQYLGKGLGFAALQTWISYLFHNSDAHKVELHTWSLNPRMIRVAEKLGFRHEGTERELIEWQGEWLDRVRFGLLRQEWLDQS